MTSSACHVVAPRCPQSDATLHAHAHEFAPQLTPLGMPRFPPLAPLAVSQDPPLTPQGMSRFPPLAPLAVARFLQLTPLAVSRVPPLTQLGMSWFPPLASLVVSQDPQLGPRKVSRIFFQRKIQIGADGSLVHNGSLSTAAVASLLRASSAVWARLGMLTRTTRESRLAALVG